MAEDVKPIGPEPKMPNWVGQSFDDLKARVSKLEALVSELEIMILKNPGFKEQ